MAEISVMTSNLSCEDLFNELADWNTFLEQECPDIYKCENGSLPSPHITP